MGAPPAQPVDQVEARQPWHTPVDYRDGVLIAAGVPERRLAILHQVDHVPPVAQPPDEGLAEGLIIFGHEHSHVRNLPSSRRRKPSPSITQRERSDHLYKP